MAIYSHSRLSTFEQCALKYKYKYIDNLAPDYEQSIEAFLGNKVHEALQLIYNCDKQKINLDELIKYYVESWNRDYNEKIKIIKDNIKAENYFNNGIRHLINYFLKNYPFKDNTIATEKKIYVNLDSEGFYKILGYIDRLVHHKETNIFEIHDYKTGALKSQLELDKDRQLALYSIGIKETFDNVSDIHLIWHFLNYSEKRTSRRTQEQLEKLKEEIIILIKKIESTINFAPNPSSLCKWCEFRSYCPVIKENPNFPEVKIKKIDISEKNEF